MITDPQVKAPTRDALIRKVRALLAKPNAPTTRRKPWRSQPRRELADIHRLDPETLDPETIGEGNQAKYGLIWSQNVANATARMFGCGTIQEDGRGGYTTFVGREGDRTTARLMADFFIQRV